MGFTNVQHYSDRQTDRQTQTYMTIIINEKMSLGTGRQLFYGLAIFSRISEHTMKNCF
jgi:hypothetical protein